VHAVLGRHHAEIGVAHHGGELGDLGRRLRERTLLVQREERELALEQLRRQNALAEVEYAAALLKLPLLRNEDAPIVARMSQAMWQSREV